MHPHRSGGYAASASKGVSQRRTSEESEELDGQKRWLRWRGSGFAEKQNQKQEVPGGQGRGRGQVRFKFTHREVVGSDDDEDADTVLVAHPFFLL